MKKQKSGALVENETLLKIIAGLLVVITLIVLWYAFDFSPNSDDVDGGQIQPGLGQEIGSVSSGDKSDKKAAVGQNNNEADMIVKAVRKHMLLPKGAVKVSNVVDPVPLQNENPLAFQYLKKDHKLLYYPNGLIIYDMSLDRIVDVIRAPVFN